MVKEYEGSRTEFMKLLADQELPPAYVVRAQRVESVWRELVNRCRDSHEELLEMPTLRLGQLGAAIGYRWASLNAFLLDGDAEYLEALHDRWKPVLRIEITPTESLTKINQRIGALRESFERCNRRWTKQVSKFSLENVNYERDQYNEYYLVEKSAALGSDRLAEMGLERLKPATLDDLLNEVPLLRVPTSRVKNSSP